MEELIDKIYEAAALPQLWPDVLETLAALGDGKGALLFAGNSAGVRWIATPTLRDGFVEYTTLGWPAKTDRAQRLFAKKHPGFLDDLDVYTPAELETEPVFVEFLRPRGLGRGVATAVPLVTGDFVTISIERDYRRGPATPAIIRALDQLRPHLARASLISARLKLREATAATTALELIGIPAGMLASGRLIISNPLMQRLIPDVIVDRRLRVFATDAAADRLLAQALHESAGKGARAVASIPIRASNDRPAYVLHLIPVRGSVHDVFRGASTILVVTPVTSTGALPDTDLIQNLFDLTPAEARIARSIAEQQTAEDMAQQFGVSVDTVRTQIKSTLKKTGLHRQTELASLLARVLVPPGHSCE